MADIKEAEKLNFLGEEIYFKDSQARADITALQEAVVDDTTYINVLDKFPLKPSDFHKLDGASGRNSGIVCEEVTTHTYRIAGTSAATSPGSFWRFTDYPDTTGTPFLMPLYKCGLRAGMTITVKVATNATIPHVSLYIVFYNDTQQYITGEYVNVKGERTYTIPATAAYLDMQLRADTGATVSETVQLSILTTENITYGNPVVLTNTNTDQVLSLRGDSIDDATLVQVSGKNLFFFASNVENQTFTNNTVNFSIQNGVFTITANDSTRTGTAVSGNTNWGTTWKTINGITADNQYLHCTKFSFPVDTIVTFTANCSQPLYYDSPFQMAIMDGETNWYVDDNGLTLKLKANHEYAMRIFVLSGWTGTVVFKPQMELGATATPWEQPYGDRFTYSAIATRPLPHCRPNQTVIWSYLGTADSTLIAATKPQAPQPKALQTFETITSSRTLRRPKALVTFIDDDTNNVEYVTRYHKVFEDYNTEQGTNLVGNYAVMTAHLNESEAGTSTAGLVALLKDYEEEGFGCIYHCQYQMGDDTRYWESGNVMYNESQIKANFMQGLREMREYGFSAYDYWVTPYGVNDEFIRTLARTHGMKCLFSMSGKVSEHSYVHAEGNVSRWDIPRISLAVNSNIDRIHTIVDTLAETGGWLVIVTHANTWGNTTTGDEHLAGMIDYVHNKGCEVVSVPDAYAQMESSFMLHDLLASREYTY